ncbi:LCP family protein [Desertihabitans brevis]|nr:LCP family protein [Desertihabitans brevis]
MSESFVPGMDAEEEPREPRRAQPRRRRWVIPVVVLLAVVLIAAGGLFGYASWLQSRVSENLDRSAELPAEENRPQPQQPAEGGDGDQQAPMNVVLMGSDSRDVENAGAGRSDTLMIAHLSGDREKAYLISFPRDMWVEIPGHGTAKINAAYAYGGTSLAVQTLEQLTDVRMDHLAVVDFEGFVALCDAVGGVTVDNETAFETKNYSFPEGEVQLDGERALEFVRERKSLPGGDLDRAENQRKVVQAILAKGLSPEVIANPGRFSEFVSGIASHTSVDAGLTDDVIRDTALSLRLNGAGDIEQLQAPDQGTGTSADGQSIVVVDEERMQEMAEALQDDTMDEYLEKYPE